jgi:riboflavin synthase
MFTGIIETVGKITKVVKNGTNRSFWIESPISAELKVDQSISHNGACLTVEKIDGNTHQVTAIEETLKKTNLGNWRKGNFINLERCMQMNGRIDGHIVQGHVDAVAVCIEKKALEGSWEFRFKFPKQFSYLIIEKGSISLNGISLTVFDVKKRTFSVAIIPYTFEHTNMNAINAGDSVNIEFDMIGKYINRKMQSQRFA